VEGGQREKTESAASSDWKKGKKDYVERFNEGVGGFPSSIGGRHNFKEEFVRKKNTEKGKPSKTGIVHEKRASCNRPEEGA